MNVAMKLLARLGGLREEQNENGGVATTATHGAGATFNPDTSIQSGEGIFNRPQEPEEEDLNKDPTIDPNSQGNDGEEGTESQQAQEGDTKDTGTSDESNSSDSGDESFEYTYGGVPVTVENKPEMVAAFKDKGLDINAVNQELFSDKGLTRETRDKLEEAFGKMSVDMYLEGWKAQNDANITKYNAEVESYNREMERISVEATGGKFQEVMSWADRNLTQKEYKQYADMVNGTDTKIAELALKDLASRSGLNKPATEEPEDNSTVRTKLLNANTFTQQGASDSMLSQAQYMELFTTQGKGGRAKYWEDPTKYDAMRNAGKQAGI